MKFIRRHPILMTLVLLFIVWQAWNPVMNLFFGGKHVLKDAIEGEWVGEVDITGGYKPALMGDTPGPHRHAVIHFNLEIYNMSMLDYKGPGEFFIIGEDKPRKIEMDDFNVGDDTRITAQIDADPDFASQINGNYLKSSPHDMTITTEGELAFHGNLHQGTIAEYDTLLRKLQAEARTR